jgi:adenine-specific DNA-methyltransferase
LDQKRNIKKRERGKGVILRCLSCLPDVHIPDAFLSYMSGEGPNLVANAAGCVCTNSVHSVRLNDGWRLADVVKRWRRPTTPLSCEVEGHPLGGGMLKLEPGEAARIVLTAPDARLSPGDERLLADGVHIMRRWRHYGAPALASSTRRLEWSKSPSLDAICDQIDLSARLAAT